MARFIFIALWCALLPTLASAQGVGSIVGTVTSKDGGAPIQGARVLLAERPTRTATTDAAGRFALNDLPPGKYNVGAAAPGFALVRHQVVVTPGGTTTVDFSLPTLGGKKDVPKDKETRAASTPVPASPAEGPPPMGNGIGNEAVSSVSGAAPASSAIGPALVGGSGRGYGAGGLGLRGTGKMGGRPSPMPPPRPMVMPTRRPLPEPRIPVSVPMPPAESNTEAYADQTENPFRLVQNEPLSTFSIDVDTASYANVRRFIEQGQKPPAGAIRIEELINYFDYDYPDPTGEHPFSVYTEVSSAPWNPAHRLIHIGLQGKRVDTKSLPPSNLVFLLDTSGSMNAPDKLPLLQQAFRLLVEQLRSEDQVAIVAYAGSAGLVLPPTSGKDKGKILAALDALSAGGSTAGGAGIQLAYQVAADHLQKGGNNRVILATDGDFNVGVSSESELVQLIEARRKSGIFLSILGFGRGNYQDAKMEKLADKGNGNNAYIDSLLEAKKVFVTEMGGTLLTLAKDVKLQLEFNPARVKAYRLIGYENRIMKNEEFNDDTKDAGELGAGHTVTALYEVIPAGSDEAVPGVDALKYQKTELSAEAKASPELLTVKFRYKKPDGDTSKLLSQPVTDADVALEKTSDDFRFSAAVAAFGMVLRGSAFKGKASFEMAAELARKATGEDKEGYRYDFVQLTKKAALLR